MKLSADSRKFSADTRIATALALLFLLIEPYNPVWRFIILVAACVLMISAIGDSDWFGSREILALNLTGITGEPVKEKRGLVFRLYPYALVITSVVVFGVLTWPHTVKAVTGTDSLSAVFSTNALPWPTPTQKGVLPPTATTAGQPGKGPTTPTNPPEKLKPQPPQPPTILKITVY